MSTLFLLPSVIEMRLLSEAVSIHSSIHPHGYQVIPVSQQFDHFLSVTLFNDLSFEVYEHLRTLSESEREKYISNSYKFILNTKPENKIEKFYSGYVKLLYNGEIKKGFDYSNKLNADDKRFLNCALRSYKKYLPKYIAFATKLFNDYNNGKFNPLEHIFGDEESLMNPEVKDNNINSSSPPPASSFKTIDISDPEPAVSTPLSKSSPVIDLAKTTNSKPGLTSNILDTLGQVFLNTFQPQPISDEELSSYLESWFDTSVTLNEWLSNRNVNVISELKEFGYDLSEEKLEEIQNHKVHLYFECVKNVTHSKLERFENIQFQENKIEVAKRDLALIQDLVDGKLDPLKEERLNQLFSHQKDWGKVTLQLDYIMRNRYSSDDSYDIHSEYSYMYAQVIYDYKSYLQTFLKNNEITLKQNLPPPQKPKMLPKAFKYLKYSSHLSALTDLLDTLKKDGFISKDTNIVNFRKIFNNTKPDHPIIWIASIGSLVYFIKSLHRLNLIEDLGDDKWEVTWKLFVDESNNQFDRLSLKGQKSPINKTIINSLNIAISHLKK